MENIKNTLNRHQKAWVYLTLATAVSGYSAGVILEESLLIALLVTFNAVIVTYVCNRIEFKTVNRDYEQARGKNLSPLQSYIYLKAERYWMAVAGAMLVIGFLLSYFMGTATLPIVIVAMIWVSLSALMWKLYSDNVYTSFLQQ